VIGPLAIAAVFLAVASDGNEARYAYKGPVLYHGTSWKAVLPILRDGFVPRTVLRQRYTLSTAIRNWDQWWAPYGKRILAAKKAKDSKAENAAYDDWDTDVYRPFMEDAAIPMSGFVYLATDIDEILTRSDHGVDGPVFIVEPTGLMVPDEDWLGASLAWFLNTKKSQTGPRDEPVLYERLALLWNSLPVAMQKDITEANENHGLESYYEFQALVGKAAIGYLLRSNRGTRQLIDLTEHCNKLAHLGPPKVIGFAVITMEKVPLDKGWSTIRQVFKPINDPSEIEGMVKANS
jgi:hypothetical protein